jgi:hypothetical protein
MNRTLEPKSLGDILSETFTIYKSNFLRLAAIVSIVAVPLAVLGFIVNLPFLAHGGDIYHEDMLKAIIGILLALPSFVAFILMAGAIIHAVAEQYFNQPVSIGRAYRFAWRRLGAMFGASVLYGLTIFGILWVATLISAIISVIISIGIGVNSEWQVVFAIASILMLIATPPAIYLGTIWNFAPQTALLEGCGPTAALSRSAALVKGSWWRVLGIVLLLLTIASIIGMIFYTPRIIVYMPKIIVAVNQATTGFIPYATTEPTSWTMIAASICALIGYIVYIPIFTIGHTLLYFDLRVRKQGYSLDALANDLGLITTSADTAASPTE